MFFHAVNNYFNFKKNYLSQNNFIVNDSARFFSLHGGQLTPNQMMMIVFGDNSIIRRSRRRFLNNVHAKSFRDFVVGARG